MSDDAAKPGESALEGYPRYARLALLALVAVAQAIPGLSILSGSDWHPPGVGAAAFTVTATALGAGVIALMFMARRRIQVLRARVVVAFCGGALLLGLGMMAAYRTTLDVRVVQYEWDDAQYRELIPFGTSWWVNAELMRRIRSANDPDPPRASAVRPSHLARTIEEYGLARVQRFYGGWKEATVAGLWLGYLGTLGLVAAAFGMAAVRLGQELAVEKEKEKAKEEEKAENGKKEEKAGKPEPAPAAASAPAAAPAAVPAEAPAASASPEQRIAELEAELRRLRASLHHTNGVGPSRSSPGSPLVVRAEIRTSGWLLLGAAAIVWWISRREEPEESRGSARPTRR
ncbi:MAG TPA: hypothetical protein VHG08_16395 [Longimicrobium sp.]|nr:hypothetical protein [Longimicrobium sp.]